MRFFNICVSVADAADLDFSFVVDMVDIGDLSCECD
jgi:hypothetical protein